MSVSIRYATVDDIKLVQDLNHQLFEHDQEYDHQLKMDWPYSDAGKKYFTSRINGEGGICVVATVENEVIGYFTAGNPRESWLKEKRYELETICLDSKYRGQGIGSQLIDFLIEYAKAHEIDSLIVNAYSPNHHALDLYRSKGFTDLDTTLKLNLLP